jgi:hypothetical protein
MSTDVGLQGFDVEQTIQDLGEKNAVFLQWQLVGILKLKNLLHKKACKNVESKRVLHVYVKELYSRILESPDHFLLKLN